ncbi:hypothetical protein GBA65_09050 [Rubrobacter marinus]|uniref:Uncharacterized protein n=1 Tax=Rubrobacter marinus TaxID=2653852 RepID=A0A6G8PWT4_9ACTN|nr:hypothetical protein [Rubrobacter marinus]QIN78645.1 hypothetical protein GBA65_09050 [Rubrobacter marinus]
MALLRTVLIFVIVVILLHLGISYLNVDPNQNGLTSGVVGLAQLLEIPAQALLQALPLSPEQRGNVDTGGLYFVGFAAIGFYFILFLLLGVGRR